MRKTMSVMAVLLVSASAASAMTAQDLDINGDGFATIAEVRTIFPGFAATDFRNLDENNDRRLSSVELDAAGSTSIIGRYLPTMSVANGLSDIDTNGDRFASRAELDAQYPGLSDDEFNQIDVNNDNRVSAPELYRPIAQAFVTRYEMTGRDVVTIMQVDRNDDAFATLAELRNVYPGLTENDFNIIDNNGDNRISSREYYTSEAQDILDQN
ncbi:hypothetical protein N9C96_02255 [bacterium]|nr:hypothetical protein [bacterium]